MGKVVDVLKAILTRIIFAGHGFVGMFINLMLLFTKIDRKILLNVYLNPPIYLRTETNRMEL